MFRKPLSRPKHAFERQRTSHIRTAVIVATAATAPVIAAVGFAGSSPTYAATAGFISNVVTDPNAVYSEPQVPKPTYLTNTTDPTFHTSVTRIAGDANSSITFSGGGSGTWGSDARQHYNDDQAWNADGSLLMLQNSGSPEQVILDGSTYQPKYGKCSNYSNYDDRWLPQLSHKYERMNVRGSTLEWFDVVNCVQTRSWSLPFTAQNDLSQNPSADGRYTALYDGKRIFVVDMDPQAPFAAYPNKRIGPAFDLSACGLSDCSVDFAEISPSGQHIIVAYNGDHNRLLDVDPNTLAITPHAYPSTVANCSSVAGHDPTKGYMFDLGHPGAGFNPFDNNEEVMVGQLRSWCPSTVDGTSLGPVVMVRLSDNKVTSLITPGNTASAYHISMVNYARPGWAYVSFWPSSGARFSDEIIAVKLDGSGSVQRLTHTHTDTTNCYRCEAHPVPSRDGMRVLFASAWNMYCGSGCGSSSNPQAYIVDARAPESSQDNAPVAALTVTPASGTAPVTVTADASGSSDTDATPIGSYRFDWGDGSSSTSTTTPTAAHTYSAAGTYSVTVTVTDTAGLSGTATASVTASSPDAAPVARLVVTPTSGTAPVTVSADASTSTDTDATPIASYRFSWGDGSADTVGSSPTTTHAFVGPGTYSVSVRVTDNAGLASTAGTTVTITTASTTTTSNLVGNPGFESSLTGWDNGGRSGTSLSAVTGGHSGSYAALLKNTSGKTINELTLNDSPNWISTTRAGTYRATLWVRSDTAGAKLVLRLREYQGGTLIGSQRASVTLSTSWQPVTMSYTAVAPGSSTIDFGAYIKNAGAATNFYADDAEIVIS